MERNFFRVSVKQKFLCLNTNYESTGIYILPRVSSILEGKNQLEMQEKMFAHIIYIKASQLIVGGEKYTIENIYPQADTITAVQNYEKLRIVVSPLTHGDVLDVNEVCTKSGSGFEIRGLKAPQNVENRVKKIINLACERKADIVLFPEMLGTDFMGTKEFWKAISNSQTNMPMITVLPSIWHEGKNELCAFDSAGLQLFTQQKQFPYYHNKNNEEYNVPAYRSYLKEAIYDMDRKINIFHWEGIGRIVTVICRDFITPDYRDMIIKIFQPTILLISSFSNGDKPFIDGMFSTAPYNCCCVWINACAAKRTIKADAGNFEISHKINGGVFIPSTPGSGRIPTVFKLGCECMNETLCKGPCLYTIDLPLQGNAEAIVCKFERLKEDNISIGGY